MTQYTGEITFGTEGPLYWDDIAHMSVEAPPTTPLTHTDHRVFHESVSALPTTTDTILDQLDNALEPEEIDQVVIMELPADEYQAEHLRHVRRDLYSALGATADTCLRNDVGNRARPGEPEGIVIHKGVLHDKSIITVARTVTTEDKQRMRQLSVHELDPALPLLPFNALGNTGLRALIAHPPGSIRDVLQVANEYSPSERALAQVFLAGRYNPSDIDEIMTVANRWTAPDRHGLWLTAQYVRNGRTLPENLDPKLAPYADRLHQYPMNPQQDLFLLARLVEVGTVRAAEVAAESTNLRFITDTMEHLARQWEALGELENLDADVR